MESEVNTMDCEGTLTKVSLLIKQNKYSEAKNKIYDFLNFLEQQNNIYKVDTHYFWSCYLKLAICTRREDNYKEAIKLTEKALSYVTTESEEYESYWMLGICYKYLNDYVKALHYYDRCIYYYSKIENIDSLVKVLKCKALMLHSEDLLESAIKTYEESKNMNIEYYNDLKETLCEIKIYNSNSHNDNIHNLISLDAYKALRNKTGI